MKRTNEVFEEAISTMKNKQFGKKEIQQWKGKDY